MSENPTENYVPLPPQLQAIVENSATVSEPAVTVTSDDAKQEVSAKTEEVIEPAKTVESTEDKTPPTDNKEPDSKKQAWYMKEIGMQRDKNSTLKAENESLAKELLRLQQVAPLPVAPTDGQPVLQPGDTKPIAMTQEQYNNAIVEGAKYVAAQEKYVSQCNNIYNKGVESFPDFKESVSILGSVGVLPAANEAPSPLMQMITSFEDDAAKILHHLAQDPDKATEIRDMPVAKQALALARIHGVVTAPPPAKEVSKAPPPINPLNAVNKAELTLDKVTSVKDHIAMRNKERAAKGLPLWV